MTDQLDSRVTGAMTAFLGDDEHPAWRADSAPHDLADDESANDDFTGDVPETTAGATIDPAPVTIETGSIETGSTETGTIVLPSSAVLADPRAVAELVALHDPEVDENELGFPAPPRRGSLDDDVLVPLVGRHTDDTATIDLIGILQAQMQLRSREAATFADWEERMRQIGTSEAIGEVERTRLHFTGVIPIQAPALSQAPALMQAPDLSQAPALVQAPALSQAPASSQAPAVASVFTTDDTQPTDIQHVAPGPSTDATASAAPAAQASDRPAPAAPAPAAHPVVTAVSVAAALVIVAALILSAVTAAATVSALFAAVAVIAGSWAGIVLGRVALGSRLAAPTEEARRRGLWAVVAGLVVGTAIGEGLVHTISSAFAWQGYLLKAASLTAVDGVLSVALGIVVAVVVGIAAVLAFERGSRLESSAA